MLAISELFLALLATLLAAHYLKLQWSRRRYPPGPTPLPIIGNLWTVRFELRSETLVQLAKTYGYLYTLWVGQKPVIVVNGYKAVRNALVSNSEDLTGRPMSPFFMELMGEKGVIVTSGHTWKQQRRFTLSTFRNLGLGKNGLEHRIQMEAQHLLETFSREKGAV